jgi:hypothetical protein
MRKPLQSFPPLIACCANTADFSNRLRLMNSQKVENQHHPSFRCKLESSLFNSLRRGLDPVFQRGDGGGTTE